jgi:methyltransferase
MVSIWLYFALLTLVAVERLAEVRISNRNAAWSFERGAVEFGQSHYPFMVMLHTVFLIGCALEVILCDRVFSTVIGTVCLVLAIGCQGLRWWVIRSLGTQWNTRIIVLPGGGRVTGGPFKYFDHPNYIAVVAEGIVLPLIHNAYVTAGVFTVLNAALLWVRIRTESRALMQLEVHSDDV